MDIIMAEGTTRLISEEKGDVLKPNFEVEVLKTIVGKNSLKNLKGFIKGSFNHKEEKKTINISNFNDFDYLDFALILTTINVDEVTQMHRRTSSAGLMFRLLSLPMSL